MQRSRIGCAWLAVGLFWMSLAARAQTISPVIAEYREKARSSFQLRNDQLVPLDVVLEPHSFSISPDGRATFRRLDSHIQVRLSSMSFRIAPQQTFTVFYDATAKQLPAWFTIYATITAPRPSGQLKVALQLPHTVYLYSRRLLDRAAIGLAASKTASGELEVTVENRGQELGRVQEVQMWAGSTRRTYPGFPLLPGGQRLLRLDWDAGPPERVVLKFDHFRVECPVREEGGETNSALAGAPANPEL